MNKQSSSSKKRSGKQQTEKSFSEGRVRTIRIEDEEILFKLRRSKKAGKVRIEISQGIFLFVIPDMMQISVDEVIGQRKEWIQENAPEEKPPERDFAPGEIYQVCGDAKSLKLERRRSNQIGDEIYLAEHLVERTSIKDQLEKVLRSHARKKIEKKVRDYSRKTDKDFNDIFIRDQKTRWGSCSGKNNLNFNWRLVLGPEHVLDYIVAHEVAHLDVKDHSEEFWDLVEDLHPDYGKGERWLEENSLKLVFDREDI